MIKKLLPAVGAVLAVASFSAPTQAAVIVNNYTGADMKIVSGVQGTFSATFGRSGITAGKFQDVYTFTLPAYLLGSATVTTSAVNVGGSDDIDLLSVFFNGVKLTGFTKMQNEFVFANDVPVIAGKANEIIINGLARGNGSYGAQAVFAPVPEPASWAMMIGGFGFVGAAMRRRSARVAIA